MAKKRRRRVSRRLTKRDKALIARFFKVSRAKAKEKARKLRADARKEAREIIAARRPTLTGKKKGILLRQTNLNTWLRETTKEKFSAQFREIRAGKNQGKYRERRTGKLVERSTVNRKIAATKYWAQVKFLQKELGVKSGEARRAYKAFKKVGLLRKLEIES